MSQYLVVAHQTATSPGLLQRLPELANDDPQAVFRFWFQQRLSLNFSCLMWEERRVGKSLGREQGRLRPFLRVRV